MLTFIVRKIFCALVFYPALRRWRPDIIHCHDLAPLATAIAAKSKSTCVVYDAHEFERSRNPPLSKAASALIRAVERYLMRKTNLLITVSPDILIELEKDFGAANRGVLILNSPQVSSARSRGGLRDALPSAGKSPLLVYVGGILINRGIESLIEVLIRLDDFHLVCVGPSLYGHDQKLKEFSGGLGVAQRVHFLEPVPPEEVVSFISDADVGTYAIPPICLSYEYSMPNKFFEMAFSGLPLAVSNLTSVSKVMADYPLGKTFRPDDVDDMAETIRSVYNQRMEYGLKGEQWQRFYREFSWEAQEATLVSAYRGMAAK